MSSLNATRRFTRSSLGGGTQDDAATSRRARALVSAHRSNDDKERFILHHPSSFNVEFKQSTLRNITLYWKLTRIYLSYREISLIKQVKMMIPLRPNENREKLLLHRK